MYVWIYMNSYGSGNWFHSRSGWSEHEIDSLLKLVESSKKSRYSDLRWSGDKNNPSTIEFANEISVSASAMQTKIRAFIRYGFIKDEPYCPLNFTSVGKIWWHLKIQEGDGFNEYADYIEGLILASSLSLYSFDSQKFTNNPTNNYRPVYELLNNVDSIGFISTHDLELLISESSSTSNFTYWKNDLLRSKIIKEVSGGFQLTNTFSNLMNAVLNVTLPTTLTDRDWDEINSDFLVNKNPYIDAILSDLDNILSGILDIESALLEDEKEIVSKIVSATDDAEASEIGLGNYSIPDTYTRTKIRKKQSAWSKEVKKSYRNTCCVTECDIQSPFLTVASHIKNYAENENRNGHRANPSNGLCLCPICHILFDRGYFTLTDNLRIKVSPKIEEINSNRIRNIFDQSNNERINPIPVPDSFKPDVEFIKYHRENVYKE